MRALKQEDIWTVEDVFNLRDSDGCCLPERLVHVSVLREIIKDLISEKGFVANHEDDKDCGNNVYATSYDVIEIADIKSTFSLLFDDVKREETR